VLRRYGMIPAMRESLVVAVLGAQLTIGGAILLHASEVSGDTDDFGGVMIFFGVVFGLLAAFRAHRTEQAAASGGT